MYIVDWHPGTMSLFLPGVEVDATIASGLEGASVESKHEVADEDAFIKEIRQTVTKFIGPIAKPDLIQVVSGLPKTRSGKIMRRILRKIASGDTSRLGDVSTLLNPEVVEEVKAGAKN